MKWIRPGGHGGYSTGAARIKDRIFKRRRSHLVEKKEENSKDDVELIADYSWRDIKKSFFESSCETFKKAFFSATQPNSQRIFWRLRGMMAGNYAASSGKW